MAKGKNKLQPIPRAAAPSAPQNAWDDLQQFSNDSATIMSNAVSAVREMASNSELNAQLKNPAEVAQKINCMARDVATYTRDHAALRERHKGRSGEAKDYNEFAEVIALAGEYDELINSFTNVVLPVVADISIAYVDASENLIVPPADDADDADTTTPV